MQPVNVITVVVDRLHAGMIGAYGNSWIHTVALDQLASESFLFDQALADSPALEQIYRGYWLGLPATAPATPSPDALPTLPRLVRLAGLQTVLITDEPAVAALPWAADFSEQVLVEPSPRAKEAADISATAMAALFGAVTDWLAHAQTPFFLWVHARGMAGPWDAPWEVRRQFAAEDDPEPPRLVEVPDYVLAEDFDPDEVLGIVHAYSGQIAVLDVCLAALVEALAGSPLAATTQLNLLSARGFALGEHRCIGACGDALYGEVTQTAWLMRFPDRSGQLARSQALVRPADLPGTILDGLGLDSGALAAGNATSLIDIVRGDSDALRDHLTLIGSLDRAIRTPAWFFRRPAEGPPELYAKPSDRWEVNEVSKLCSEVAAALDELSTREAEGGEAVAPLAEALVTEID